MSRGRKERTPAQLAVLAQAREKAKIVIAERAKLNALAKTEDSEPEPVSKEAPQEPAPREPEPVPVSEDPASESEDEEPRLSRREVGEMSQRSSPKYHYINGMYIKIK
jgi:hypothetical protein